MSIKINKWGYCIDDETKKPCIHNGEVCACSMYAGNPSMPVRFQSKE